MLLSHKTTVKLNENEANIIGHMCYAAYKLWNVCNYERHHYKDASLPEGITYPDWYYQKKAHKNDLWFKQLPSQTAQEVCKLLDKSWKSFYALLKSKGVENPQPPKYKHENIVITYMQNGIVHEPGTQTIRLTLSKQLKEYMKTEYGIEDNYLNLKNMIFKNFDNIKQIKIYPPANGESSVIVIYEVPDTPKLADNGKYLGIDLGLHNLLTCYNSESGETFIAGRKYLSLCNYYNKEIARIQSQWSLQQVKRNIQHPKSSKHISRLHVRKTNAINDYLHKVTRTIVNYCKDNDINTVVIGDITGIRKNSNLGHVTNQKLHSLPYQKLYTMLEYKLVQQGITFVKQEESYSSQTSPLASRVDKANAVKSNRVNRGTYKDGCHYWNADCVGAFNITRLYLDKLNSSIVIDPSLIKSPYILKVAV